MARTFGDTSWRALRAVAGPARPLYDRLVGRGRTLPDFVILGAMKAGTSSLFAYLGEHPRVMAPPGKEIHFFDLAYRRGPDWYRRHFPRRAEVAAAERRLGASVAIGEATPYYLFHPLAAGRIHGLLPDARLIVLLRDPVARAFSHYRHMIQHGRESLSFADALAAEEARLRAAEAALHGGDPAGAAAHRYHSYRARGLYLEQLLRYRAVYPAQQILVLRSEDMFADPQAALDAALAFLGLDPWRLQDATARNRGPALGANPCAAALRAFYAPHNRALSDFLGRDMGW
jgi:hypothetical protein